MKTFRLAALAALVLVLAAPASAASPAGTITVDGRGTVATVPDRASFSFGVESRAATAAAALSATADAAKKVVAALKAAGIDAADLQTEQISLQPQLDDKGRKVTGYLASSSVSAVVRDLGRAGAVVDAAVGAGADTVAGPSLTRADTDALYREALKRAVADARGKAQALAAAAGVALGRVRSVEEGSQAPVPVTARSAPSSKIEIEPGTQQVEATVTVVFAIR